MNPENAPVLHAQVDWATAQLPQTWPDTSVGRGLRDVLRLLMHPFRKRTRVQLPAGLPGAERIPRYALLEFHNLPNGNYSNSLTRGYITGFDVSMLGEMGRLARRMARTLAHCESVLDLGCGGGRTAATLHREGIADVWGLDPSPYLLQHAARMHPQVRFVQGVMEELPFPDGRFGGVTASFVFHEVPPQFIRRGLAEIARVLRPGGLLLVAEPSPLQFHGSFISAVRRFGWRGGYFWTLVRCVHEPFVKSWHRFALVDEAARFGLELVEVEEGMPIKYWALRKAG